MKRSVPIYRWAWLLVLIGVVVRVATASEPRVAAGTWERIGETNSLLRDPLSGRVVALLDDPTGWHFTTDGSGVIQGSLEETASGLAVFTVQDVTREYWAQPCVWNTFQKGPSAFSGFGRDPGPREWAGRQALDRRAYALDPGWKTSPLVSEQKIGVGYIKITRSASLLTLTWHALPGRVYVIEFTPALGQSFLPTHTVTASTEGDVTVPLPSSLGAAFYRVSEQVY
jgi:hypothetical protein